MKFGVGQAVTRKEDDPLLRGGGRYVADYAPVGLLHGVVVRSPHAHAKFHIDAGKARATAGVRIVLTAEDLADLGDLPCTVAIPGTTIPVPPYPILARDEVRHVGDAVAFIVADTLDAARDGAEALEIEWQAMPHVVGGAEALEQGAPFVWPERPGNVAFEVTFGDRAETEKAFALAAHVVSLKLVNQRITTNYLDTRGAIGEYDAAAGHYTLTIGSQGSHPIRDIIAKHVLKIPPEKMRVVTPDVGGGFGTKLFAYREYALVAVAAKKTGRPVKWIAERSEHFLGDTQGRDNITDARLALDDKGHFIALEVDTIADMGAYLSTYAPYIPYIGAGMLPGVYDIPACFIRVRGSYTHSVPVDAYRGAGRPEASYVIERIVDVAARELGMAPDALRRKNFIKPRQMPYETPTGKVYDTGEFAGHMARAQEIADWGGFKKRASAARKNGKLRGIGLATYIEACGGNGPETATVNLDKDGGITLLIGTQSTGQGHATSYAQIIAEHLQLPPERVRMEQGDTARIPSGRGRADRARSPRAAPRSRRRPRRWPTI